MCSAAYQLKSSKRPSSRIVDGACSAMLEAINSNAVPNLLVLNYDLLWSVTRLVLIPSFFFTASAIQPRRPLSFHARRAGWVGCNIILERIADDGRLSLVVDGEPVVPSFVRAAYARIRPLSQLDVKIRGWALDVLRVLGRSPGQSSRLAIFITMKESCRFFIHRTTMFALRYDNNCRC